MNSASDRPAVDEDDEPPAKCKTVQLSSMISNNPSNNGHTDFLIINGSKEYPVHRMVISKYSDYFKVLLEGSTRMRESQTNQVHLQGISEAAGKAVVSFMYDEEVEVTWSNLDDLLNAASHLQISSLLDQCTKWLTSSFTLSKYRLSVDTARKYCLTDVLNDINKLTARDFIQVVTDRELFYGLDIDELEPIIVCDCLQVQSEKELMDNLEQWLANHLQLDGQRLDASVTKLQHGDISRLLRHVRFRLMSEEELEVLAAVSYYPADVHMLIQSAIEYCNNFASMKPVDSTVQNRIRADTPSLVLLVENGVNKKHEMLACRKVGDMTETYSLYIDAANQKTCGVVAIDNCLYTVSVEHYGGFDDHSTIWLRCFHPCMRDQRPLACPQLQVIPAGITVVGRRIYLCGGVSKSHTTFTNQCEAFHVDNLEWERVAPLPTALHNCAAASLSGGVYLSGGQIQEMTLRPITNQLLFLKQGAEQWERLAGMNVARRGHSMLSVGGEALIACGGLPAQTRGSHSTVIPLERYNVETNQWTELVGCSTLRGPSLGHFILLPHQPSKLYILGHEMQKAQEHEIWCTDFEDGESAMEGNKVHMTLPERYKLNDAFAAYLYLNYNDVKLASKLAK